MLFGKRGKKKNSKGLASDLRKFISGEDIAEQLLSDRLEPITRFIIDGKVVAESKFSWFTQPGHGNYGSYREKPPSWSWCTEDDQHVPEDKSSELQKGGHVGCVIPWQETKTYPDKDFGTLELSDPANQWIEPDAIGGPNLTESSEHTKPSKVIEMPVKGKETAHKAMLAQKLEQYNQEAKEYGVKRKKSRMWIEANSKLADHIRNILS